MTVNIASGPYDFSRFAWPHPADTSGLAQYITIGELVGTGSFRVCYLGKYTITNQLVVLKKFRTHSPMEEKYWTQDILASKEAQRFAELFNAEITSSKPLNFIQPSISCCLPTICAPFSPGEKVLVEPFLGKDVYKKFSSNSGWLDHTSGFSMPAFSHFTYHNSGGQMLVCDLQGVKLNDKYVLTDPVICSLERKFGLTDLGEDGIRSFFYYHVCAGLCKPSWIKHQSPKPYPTIIQGTTYIM